MTLEHIIGQLDVLTQVGSENISEQGIICRNQEPWVWGGDALLLITPSRCHALGRIPEVEGDHVRGKGAKGCGPMKS